MERLSKNRLAFIASLDLPISHDKVIDIWIKYETAIRDSEKNHGKRHTLELYKNSYKFLRNYLLELPTQPLAFCKVDRFGLPKTLWSLRPLIKGDRTSKRVALSIARSFERIRLEIDYSKLSNITDENSPQVERSVRDINKKFKRFLKRFVKNRPWYLGSSQTPIEPWSKVSTTLSKGPNGPAVASAHLDALAILRDAGLQRNLFRFNDALGQSWINNWCLKQAMSSKYEGPLYTGRLGFSSEPGGKTRIFAIGDYWSQLSLKPIQLTLYSALRNISTDATKDQEKGFQTLLKESKGRPTYCFDLESASDRIPAVMQKYRLELIFGSNAAESWYQVMTQRDFYVKALGQSVRWSVGQPLGLLSSFPSFALWHHDIIQFAANWENFHRGKPLRFFKQYRLLGDDVVIFDTKVARRYQWLLKKIGLTINLDKSVIGDAGNNQLEFVKRLALRGQEMSSIKYNILSKTNKFYLLDLIEILYKRDFISPDTGHRGLSRVLKSVDLQRFQFISQLRFSVAPQIILTDKEGNVTSKIDREKVIKMITIKRTARIIKKAMEVKPLDMETEFPNLVKGFNTIDVSCDEKTLADRSIGDLSGSHPIVLGLTQTSRELQFLMFAVLDDLEPDDVSPVEYLPIVSSRSYFHDRKDRGMYLSEILLECLQDILDE